MSFVRPEINGRSNKRRKKRPKVQCAVHRCTKICRQSLPYLEFLLPPTSIIHYVNFFVFLVYCVWQVFNIDLQQEDLICLIDVVAYLLNLFPHLPPVQCLAFNFHLRVSKLADLRSSLVVFVLVRPVQNNEIHNGIRSKSVGQESHPEKERKRLMYPFQAEKGKFVTTN